MNLDIQKRQKKREIILNDFDPSENGLNSHGIFGLPFGVEESELVIIPVPWDVTSSYKDGSLNAPEAVLTTSWQIDLYRDDLASTWYHGIALDKIPNKWKDTCIELKKIRKRINRKSRKVKKGTFDQDLFDSYKNINYTCILLNEWVEQKATRYLDENKTVAVLGGDHSVCYGLVAALAKRYPAFSVLQIDAHADLREKYESFDYSHASIMFNLLKIPEVEKIVQVGVRDFSRDEHKRIRANKDRIKTFRDHQLQDKLLSGQSWKTLTRQMITELGEFVYVSFDIDGLQPYLCPNTGTPVPGGLAFEQAAFLLGELQKSGKQIIGFDLCEVAPARDTTNDWDANVGMRILYELSCRTLLSRFHE